MVLAPLMPSLEQLFVLLFQLGGPKERVLTAVQDGLTKNLVKTKPPKLGDTAEVSSTT